MIKNDEEIKTLMPESFPMDWACEWGQDERGLWNALVYKGVRQVFRWMMPGRFMMGSPESEPERRAENEQLHEVTLTKGFWLGETTCTQALWEAVMGNNPSRFKGEERPVEQISWQDVKDFIQRLNHEVVDLFVRLPTEAEWEYACRAGTTTPFSSGDKITSDQVNCDGGIPFAGGEKGRYRGESVEVKSLPPNPWGLYEMHGNVWEWCEDRYQKNFERDAYVNPTGPAEGDHRVLRGGSWDDDGGEARSACRGWLGSSSRSGRIGFRLAQGLKPVVGT